MYPSFRVETVRGILVGQVVTGHRGNERREELARDLGELQAALDQNQFVQVKGEERDHVVAVRHIVSVCETPEQSSSIGFHP